MTQRRSPMHPGRPMSPEERKRLGLRVADMYATIPNGTAGDHRVGVLWAYETGCSAEEIVEAMGLPLAEVHAHIDSRRTA